MAAKKDGLPARIKAVLRKELPQRDVIIDVSPSGVRDNVHVLVVARVLDKMTENEKQEYLWGLLEDAVKRRQLKKGELSRVSLVLPISIEELRR